MKPPVTGKTIVAGVVGQPIAHAMSPLIHNAWLEAAGIDGIYVAFAPQPERFDSFIEGLRGGAIRGLNVTIPFKEHARYMADRLTERADAAGAANLLVFEENGEILADNTDGIGLLLAFEAQAPDFDPASGPVVVLGAGGAARGAVAALTLAGAPQVRVVNRTFEKAEALAGAVGRTAVAVPMEEAERALADAAAVINATSAGLGGGAGPPVPLEAAPPGAVVMDVVYKPLETEFLKRAKALGLRTVDGLEMLVRQAEPSFEAFFGVWPPAEVDARALALKALEA